MDCGLIVCGIEPSNSNILPGIKDEAKSIMRIIRLFKQAMAPIRSDSMLFLKSPHTFQLEYKYR